MLAVGGCFGDPPEVGGSDGDGGDASTGSSDETGSQTSSTDESGELTEGTTTTTGDESGTSSSSSSSTGDPLPVCDCPPSAVLCESFEGAFELVEPWASATLGAADPAPSTRFAACGNASLEARADVGTDYVQAAADLPAATFSQYLVSFHLAVRLGDGCVAQGPLRVTELQFWSAGSLVYFVGLWLADGTVQLAIQGTGGGTQGDTIDVMQIGDGVWATFDVQIDFEKAQPIVDLWVDAEHAFNGSSDLMVDVEPPTLAPHMVIGAYRGGPQFDSSCAVALDDVWIEDGGAAI